MTLKGFDDSHWQVVLTEALAKRALAEGYVFGFHKTTESAGFIDPEFAASMAGAKAAGLMLGGYHLGRNTSTGVSQYAFFKTHCPTGPAMLDVEAGPAMSDDRSDDWVDAALKDKRQVVVYGIFDQINRHRTKALLFATSLQPVGDAIFTQDGNAGIYGDLDHFHGTMAQLTAIFKGAVTVGDSTETLKEQSITIGERMAQENYVQKHHPEVSLAGTGIPATGWTIDDAKKYAGAYAVHGAIGFTVETDRLNALVSGGVPLSEIDATVTVGGISIPVKITIP